MAGELAGRTVAIDDVRVDPLTDTPLAQETYAADADRVAGDACR